MRNQFFFISFYLTKECVDERSLQIKCNKVKEYIKSEKQFVCWYSHPVYKQVTYKKYTSIYMLNFLAVSEVDSQTQVFVQFSNTANLDNEP